MIRPCVLIRHPLLVRDGKATYCFALDQIRRTTLQWPSAEPVQVNRSRCLMVVMWSSETAVGRNKRLSVSAASPPSSVNPQRHGPRSAMTPHSAEHSTATGLFSAAARRLDEC